MAVVDQSAYGALPVFWLGDTGDKRPVRGRSDPETTVEKHRADNRQSSHSSVKEEDEEEEEEAEVEEVEEVLSSWGGVAADNPCVVDVMPSSPSSSSSI